MVKIALTERKATFTQQKISNSHLYGMLDKSILNNEQSGLMFSWLTIQSIKSK
jgi:hypothetical protein